MPSEFKDFMGNVLAKGDFIVYGYISGRSPSLRFGKVLGIRTKVIGKGHYLYPDGIQPKLAIQGCEYYDAQGKHPASQSLIAKSQLERADGVFQIDRSQIPVEVQKLLDGVPVDKN